MAQRGPSVHWLTVLALIASSFFAGRISAKHGAQPQGLEISARRSLSHSEEVEHAAAESHGESEHAEASDEEHAGEEHGESEHGEGDSWFLVPVQRWRAGRTSS